VNFGRIRYRKFFIRRSFRIFRHTLIITA
jgi:hypothetical protein